MDLIVFEPGNRKINYDRIKEFKINESGRWCAIDENGYRIFGQIETGNSVQLTEELPPDCYSCPCR